MENHEKRPLPEARTYTVEDIAAMLNIGRTSAYTLVKEGHFIMRGRDPAGPQGVSHQKPESHQLQEIYEI